MTPLQTIFPVKALVFELSLPNPCCSAYKGIQLVTVKKEKFPSAHISLRRRSLGNC